MLKESLNIDDIDVQIMSLCTTNPSISQTEIAEKVQMSQPSVYARMQKLKKRGLLATTVGIEINKTNMFMARVDVTAANADGILNRLRGCSFFANGFIMSGKHNLSLFIVAYSLKKIEALIDQYLRSNPDVKDINMNVMVSSAKPFVCSIDVGTEQHACSDPDSCKNCSIVHRKE